MNVSLFYNGSVIIVDSQNRRKTHATIIFLKN